MELMGKEIKVATTSTRFTCKMAVRTLCVCVYKRVCVFTLFIFDSTF